MAQPMPNENAVAQEQDDGARIDEGTTFTIELPMQQVRPATPGERP